jgi:N-acetylmuramoyl-L-alanine amidase
VSAHYLVNDLDDSEIYQLVDENKRAYHAGISEWRKDVGLNDTSIGIEIVNNGFTEQGGKKTFYPFPDYQVKKVAELVKDLVTLSNFANQCFGAFGYCANQKTRSWSAFSLEKIV